VILESGNLSVTKFGETLRTFRESSSDPERHRKHLSQGRLGELIGHEMDDRGFSGAAVSDWERGKSRISAEDRKVLIAIIKVLHQCGGVGTPSDANLLLETGNYRALNLEEGQKIFGERLTGFGVGPPVPEGRTSKSFVSSLLESLFSTSDDNLRALLANAEKGPSPSWPRKLAVLMRKASEQISLSQRTVLWIGIWWIAWWLTAPSLRWPFLDRDAAFQAIGMYVAGTLLVPLLIGMLIDTKHNEYWKTQGLADSTLLRLYTYQGAGIGFNLGYFLVFPLVLVTYYLNLESSTWLTLVAVTVGLILGNMSARVVPHNLWLAYRRLRFADGAIFFVVAFLGPLWGVFFLEYYSVLLSPFWGSAIILVALLLFIMFTVQQSKKGLTQSKPNLK
jgi:hypothetical protein